MIMENYRYASKWSLENFAVQFETLLRMKIDTYTREYRDTKKIRYNYSFLAFIF